jgi:hypothetical protein
MDQKEDHGEKATTGSTDQPLYQAMLEYDKKFVDNLILYLERKRPTNKLGKYRDRNIVGPHTIHDPEPGRVQLERICLQVADEDLNFYPVLVDYVEKVS